MILELTGIGVGLCIRKKTWGGPFKPGFGLCGFKRTQIARELLCSSQ